MIAVSYHDTVNVLQGYDLASTGPFDRADWYADLVDASQSVPCVAVASKGDAMAALVMQQQGRRLESLVNWYSFTWRPLITPQTDEAALLSALAHDLKGRSERITLWPIPDEDISASRLETAFRDAGWFVIREPCDTNHVLTVGRRSYADYLATRPGPLRTTLKRKAKKVEVEIASRFDPCLWEQYEAIYSRSWKPEEGDSDLLRRFAEAEGEAGRIRFAVARHEGRSVAAQFWTVEAGTAFIHKLAHAEESRNLSAGTTLTAALMEQVIDRDAVGFVDFGTGDDNYKRDWMDTVRPRYRLDCLNPASPRSWPHMARAALRHLASRPVAG